jgi:hypothetical protein
MRLVKLPFFIVIILLQAHCAHMPMSDQIKINGVSLEAPSKEIDGQVMTQVKEQVAANWVCLMPYAYSKEDETNIGFDLPWQWWGEREEGIAVCAAQAKAQHLKIMLKPHLWIGWGSFTGDLDFDNAAEWDTWNESYRAYILKYARLAEEHQIDLFCIGTELKTPVKRNPEFWTSLIDEVRAVYSGLVTYAGNWDSYKDFPFWNKLDYIGVDAYFPVSEEQTASVDSCAAGWEKWADELSRISDAMGKKILFTEYGYRSVDFCAKKPWDTSGSDNLNNASQANALEGLYQRVWKKDWLAGGFIWKWHDDSHRNEERQGSRFTPQGKEAEAVVKKYYKQ